MPNESPEAAKAVAYCKKVVEASIRDALRPLEGAPVGNVIEVLKKNIQELLRVSLAEPSGRCVDLLLNFTNEGETIVPGDAYTAYVLTLIQLGMPRKEIVAKLPYLSVHKYSTRVQFEHFSLSWDPAKKGAVTMQPVQAVERIMVDFVIDKDGAFVKGDKPCPVQ